MHPHGTTCQEHPKYSSTKQELEVASNTRAWVRFHLQQAALPLSVEQYIKKILSLVTAALDKKGYLLVQKCCKQDKAGPIPALEILDLPRGRTRVLKI